MQLYDAQRVNIVMLFLQIKAMQKSKCHREEPPQNPNTSKNKLFFYGSFYMIGTLRELMSIL